MVNDIHKVDLIKATKLAQYLQDALDNFPDDVNIFEIACAAQLVIYLESARIIQKGDNQKW